ncbi:MAG: HEAT repeat domain-containing protein [Elusimicrobia bacterium]|nr:HEAT repeat domain-containing protein [Elusimicrobiota bacterium]
MIRIIIIVIVLAIAGFFASRSFVKKAPPPPPVVEAPPPPPPLITPEEEAKIIKATRDLDSDVRWEAVQLLNNIKSPSSNAVLFERLHKDDSLEMRMRVAGLLRTKTGADVAEQLVLALQEAANPPELRIAVLGALASVGEMSVIPQITDCLKDPNELVRKEALKTVDALNRLREAEIKKAEEERQRLEAEQNSPDADREVKKLK